jgi:hypothetical protein
MRARADEWTSIVDGNRAGALLLIAILAIGAALRVWLSFHDDGIYWPDEIYESLEPAHRLVFGYGLVSWEFIEGARNWALPGFVAAVLRLSAAIGLNDPRQYLSAIRLVLSGMGVASAYGSYLLARRLGTSTMFAACGAAFFALAAPAIYFAPRALAETTSALPIVLGLALALPPDASRSSRIAGASLLGLATLLRLQNAVFCVGFLAVVVVRRQWARTRDAVIVLASWAVLLGLVDKLTWGEWFRSAFVYSHTILAGFGPVTGPSPASYYIEMFLTSMPLVTIIVAALCVVGVFRAPALAFIVGLFFAVHVAIDNKAYRYVIPAFPVFGALAGIGLQAVWERRRRALAAVAAMVLLAAVSWSALTYRRLTFRDVGPFERTRPNESAYDAWGPVNRLLIAASRQSDLCGLLVETDYLTWIGGYSYFHRHVPLYQLDGPPRNSHRYNYVISVAGVEAGEVAAVDGNRVLVRLRNASCEPDPQYDPRLPGYDQVHKMLGF